MRFFLFLFGPFLVSGCMSITPLTPQSEIIDRPELGVATTVNIGDTVLSKGQRYTFPGINLVGPLSKGSGIQVGYDIPAQRLPAVYEDKNYTYFSASRMTQKDMLLGTMPANGGICISKKDPTKIGVYIMAGACPLKAVPEPVIEPTNVTAENAPGFVQELIYNGRVDDYVKFLYREFSQDVARPAFSQEVQYDLGDAAEIGSKDARLEILSATNTELTYRVLSTFPDPY